MKEILLNISPEETRMALLEDGRLAEFEIERPFHSHLVGNIYKGQVQKVLPGMQAAFVDIKQSKNAFLYLGDGMPAAVLGKNCTDKQVHNGQSLMIQIEKDATGTKGPRATTHISLPGRNMVLMPTVSYIAISRRIEEEAERTRLRSIAEKICPEGMGLIVRTAAAGQSEEALANDVKYLCGLWDTLKARQDILAAPVLLYRDADLIIRIVRDNLTSDIDRLIIDDKAGWQRIQELLKNISPELLPRIRFYNDDEPLFDKYGLEDDLAMLHNRKVELPSGGFLVFDRTEALTVVDVNTGKYVGQGNLEETIYNTNMEAAEEILRQLRLRDIGGIIIVDFIDMACAENKNLLLEYMREKVKFERVKTNIVGITQLGLVEITRKKSRKNFTSIFYTECPCCQGSGSIVSAETVGVKICQALRRVEKNKHHSAYEIRLNSRLNDYLRTMEMVNDYAETSGIEVHYVNSDTLRQRAFQLVAVTEEK